MSSKIKKLEKITRQAEKMTLRVEKITRRVQANISSIGTGIMGIANVGSSIKSLVQPALEFNRAMNDVASLGATQDALSNLQSTALDCSIQWGVSAEKIIRSSHNIQSAISGLQGKELSTFAAATTLLAKSTKTESAVITGYMSTMYRIFQDKAEKMGKSKWAEQMAGQTDLAAKMFHTSGAQFASFFAVLKDDAAAMGIGVTEQMAILGKLQNSMSGSEAASKYKAFIQGVGKAQSSLGLAFMDSDDNMLGVLDIVEKIKGKFGDSLSNSDKGMLVKAFGSEEAVAFLDLMMKDTKKLASSIKKLNAVSGMDKAKASVASTVDPWMQLDRAIMAVRISFGQTLLPILDPIIQSFRDGCIQIVKWNTTFPNIAASIGKIVVAGFAFVAALSALAAITGMAQLTLTGFGLALQLGTWIIATFRGQTLLAKTVIFGWRTAIWLTHTTLKILRVGMLAFQGVMWLVNAAMYANPIGLIVLGIAALVAGVAAAIYWWDDLKAAFLDMGWTTALAALALPFAPFLEGITAVIGWWDNLKAAFLDMNWVEVLGSAVQWITDKIAALGQPVKWVWNKISSLNPFGGGDQEQPSKTQSAMLDQSRQAIAAPGSVTNHVINQANSSRGNQRTIGQVVINNNGGMDADGFVNELAMAGA